MELQIVDKHDYLSIGYTLENMLCGMALESVHGILRFGLYNMGKQVQNLRDEIDACLQFVLKYYYSYLRNTNQKSIYTQLEDEVFWGLMATDDYPSCGIHFKKNGDVYVGCSLDNSIFGDFLVINDGRILGYKRIFRDVQMESITKATYLETNYSPNSLFSQLFELAK